MVSAARRVKAGGVHDPVLCAGGITDAGLHRSRSSRGEKDGRREAV